MYVCKFVFYVLYVLYVLYVCIDAFTLRRKYKDKIAPIYNYFVQFTFCYVRTTLEIRIEMRIKGIVRVLITHNFIH